MTSHFIGVLSLPRDYYTVFIKCGGVGGKAKVHVWADGVSKFTHVIFSELLLVTEVSQHEVISLASPEVARHLTNLSAYGRYLRPEIYCLYFRT